MDEINRSVMEQAYLNMCIDMRKASVSQDEQRQLLVGAAADAFEAAYPDIVSAVRRKWSPITP